MRDFTLLKYQELLYTIQKSRCLIRTFADVCESGVSMPAFVLRHDVDRRPGNALRMARIEQIMGVKASYYFRIVKGSYDPDIICRIHEMGHEIGYHYEDLSLAKGDMQKARETFVTHLNQLRTLVPVKTITMQGSPLSAFDNRKILEYLNFGDLEILGEPYLLMKPAIWDYFTDTGRRWNGDRVNRRDKLSQMIKHKVVHTNDLIRVIDEKELKAHVMLNIHPERWDDNWLPWIKQLVWQNVKNPVKYFLFRS
ncbi:hypothetical protein DMA11_08560 [Marinilabiliaceae bacterium JC017]|nr:hypothetical protein DMA11_08560 [Marinilabiliaceae bacterium JC017]